MLRLPGSSLLRVVASFLPLALWYGIWGLLSALAYFFLSSPGNARLFPVALPVGLMFLVFYWQLGPLLTSLPGASLDLRRLSIYPVPVGQLFVAEVLLRFIAAPELPLLLAAVGIGLMVNPSLNARTAPAALAMFALFNACLAAGLRYPLQRWAGGRHFHQAVALILILMVALPQVVLATNFRLPVGRWILMEQPGWWLCTATARASLGCDLTSSFVCLAVWLVAAYYFGHWQFSQSICRDVRASSDYRPRMAKFGGVVATLAGLVSVLFPDRLAALVEKELCSLARTPRFRVVFMMGFSFGVMVFLPMALHAGRESGRDPFHDYLTIICAYALLLLADVVFWNVFGLDNNAAQMYFLLPCSTRYILLAKNLAAITFVVLETTLVVVVWKLIRMPASAGSVAQAYAVTLCLTIYLLSAGNLSSVRLPYGVKPERATSAVSSGRVRAFLLLIYPLISVPVVLAFVARYAFDTQAAFWMVLGFAACLGVAVYRLAMESAIKWIAHHREEMLKRLTASSGPAGV